MSWNLENGGKAETMVIDLQEQTGLVFRNNPLKEQFGNVRQKSPKVRSLSPPKKHDCSDRCSPEPERKFRPKRREHPGRGSPSSSPVKKHDCQNLPLEPFMIQKKLRAHTMSRGSKPYNPPYVPINTTKRSISPRGKDGDKDVDNNLNTTPIIKVPKANSKKNLATGTPENVEDDDYHFMPTRLFNDIRVLNESRSISAYESMELENAILKNELELKSQEIKMLTEKITNSVGNEELSKQIEQLKADLLKANEERELLEAKYQGLESEKRYLETKNEELNSCVQKHENEENDKRDVIENELHRAHSIINTLRENLENSRDECKRLQQDWESYRSRVDNMLASKDQKIKELQSHGNLTEDAKLLFEQIHHLKEEREFLSDVVAKVKSECNEIRSGMESIESRYRAAVSAVGALRDAYQSERANRCQADLACATMAQEIRNLKEENKEIVENLRAMILEKTEQLALQDDSLYTTSGTEANTLNVADYEHSNSSSEKEKLQHLSTLMQNMKYRQSIIVALRGDNNSLRMQLDRAETKLKELQMRGHSDRHVYKKSSHSSESKARLKQQRHVATTASAKMSMLLSFFVESHPLFRVFIVVYVICLQLWVIGDLPNDDDLQHLFQSLSSEHCKIQLLSLNVESNVKV